MRSKPSLPGAMRARRLGCAASHEQQRCASQTAAQPGRCTSRRTSPRARRVLTAALRGEATAFPLTAPCLLSSQPRRSASAGADPALRVDRRRSAVTAARVALSLRHVSMQADAVDGTIAFAISRRRCPDLDTATQCRPDHGRAKVAQPEVVPNESAAASSVVTTSPAAGWRRNATAVAMAETIATAARKALSYPRMQERRSSRVQSGAGR